GAPGPWRLFVKHNGRKLFYIGGAFDEQGRPVAYATMKKAEAAADQMRRKYRSLKNHGIYAERILKGNPSPRANALRQAADKLEAFTGHRATRIKRVRERPVSTGLVVGPLLAVAYEAVRDGKREQY